MASRDLPARIATRASNVGVSMPADLGEALAAYLDLLGRWNRKINLTALDVDPPSDEAIDRLLVEPLVAPGTSDRRIVWRSTSVPEAVRRRLR